MSIDAQCPFYLSEKSKFTYCEYGTLRPPDKEARDEIVYNYCADKENYKTCPFYRALEHYYERKFKAEEEAEHVQRWTEQQVHKRVRGD